MLIVIPVDAKELKLKANHNDRAGVEVQLSDAKELKLKANHNTKINTDIIHIPAPSSPSRPLTSSTPEQAGIPNI